VGEDERDSVVWVRIANALSTWKQRTWRASPGVTALVCSVRLHSARLSLVRLGAVVRPAEEGGDGGALNRSRELGSVLEFSGSGVQRGSEAHWSA